MNDTFNRRIQAFLAIAITFGFFGVIAVLMYRGTIDPGVKDILLVLLGALLASYKELTGYFFGSSSGSAKKDDTIVAQAAAAATIAAGPTPPAASSLTDATPTGTPADPVSVTEVPPRA